MRSLVWLQVGVQPGRARPTGYRQNAPPLLHVFISRTTKTIRARATFCANTPKFSFNNPIADRSDRCAAKTIGNVCLAVAGTGHARLERPRPGSLLERAAMVDAPGIADGPLSIKPANAATLRCGRSMPHRTIRAETGRMPARGWGCSRGPTSTDSPSGSS